MKDYKHMHASNRPANRPKQHHVELWLVMVVSITAVMWYGLIQATGGL